MEQWQKLMIILAQSVCFTWNFTDGVLPSALMLNEREWRVLQRSDKCGVGTHCFELEAAALQRRLKQQRRRSDNLKWNAQHNWKRDVCRRISSAALNWAHGCDSQFFYSVHPDATHIGGLAFPGSHFNSSSFFLNQVFWNEVRLKK